MRLHDQYTGFTCILQESFGTCTTCIKPCPIQLDLSKLQVLASKPRTRLVSFLACQEMTRNITAVHRMAAQIKAFTDKRTYMYNS